MLLGRFHNASMRINISHNNRPTCANAGESAVRRDYWRRSKTALKIPVNEGFQLT